MFFFHLEALDTLLVALLPVVGGVGPLVRAPAGVHRCHVDRVQLGVTTPDVSVFIKIYICILLMK